MPTKTFLDIVVNIFTLLDCQKMIVILTDGEQVESIKKIKVSEIIKIIGEDFMRYQGLPDILYEIKNNFTSKCWDKNIAA